MTSRYHLLTALATTVLIALGLSACGGSDETQDSSTTTTEAMTVDTVAFKDCILSGSLDVGIYEEVDSPSPVLSDAAPDAEFFEVSKGDDGIAAFYVFEDAAGAEDFATSFEQTIADFGTAVGESGGVKGVTGSVETTDAVAVGLIPFSAEKQSELTEEVLADVSTCLDESATG